MGRERNGSSGAACGHTPSSREARMMRSALIRRASRTPRIFRRGWVGAPVGTISAARRPSSSSANPRGVTGGKAALSSIREASNAAVRSPASPAHRSPTSRPAPLARVSSARAKPWAACDALAPSNVSGALGQRQGGVQAAEQVLGSGQCGDPLGTRRRPIRRRLGLQARLQSGPVATARPPQRLPFQRPARSAQVVRR